jgi:prophage regulatory protein
MTATTLQFLRLPDVVSRVGLKRACIYALAAAGQFPKPIKLSERCSAWLSSEVEEWMSERVAKSRAA